jgi:hypothetical protein
LLQPGLFSINITGIKPHVIQNNFFFFWQVLTKKLQIFSFIVTNDVPFLRLERLRRRNFVGVEKKEKKDTNLLRCVFKEKRVIKKHLINDYPIYPFCLIVSCLLNFIYK